MCPRMASSKSRSPQRWSDLAKLSNTERSIVGGRITDQRGWHTEATCASDRRRSAGNDVVPLPNIMNCAVLYDLRVHAPPSILYPICANEPRKINVSKDKAEIRTEDLQKNPVSSRNRVVYFSLSAAHTISC